MVPRKIINRLLLGRSVAAEVSPSNPACRAWVDVVPLLSPTAAFEACNPVTEHRLVNSDGREVEGYRVRYTEVPIQYRAWYDRRTREETIDVNDEESLELVLVRWLTDISRLRPSDFNRLPLWPT